MVALRPDEWKPICCSASSTATLACVDSAAAADRPAIPPPMTRMSAVATASGGRQPLADHLAVAREPDRLDDLVVVGERRRALLLVPEGGDEIVQVAREQGRGVRGE